MAESFLDQPILNSPYEYPGRHWELDESGQPTNRILDRRRSAEYITPIPKPKKKRKAAEQQEKFTAVWEIQSDFEAKVAVECEKMMEATTAGNGNSEKVSA